MMRSKACELPGLLVGLYMECISHQRLPGTGDEWDVHVWSQTWPDGGCGFGGTAVGSTHIVPTIVLSFGSDYVVYHNGAYAYTGDRRYGLFWTAFKQMDLPGKVDWEKDLAPSDKWLEHHG